jgi:NSS family neurotransmitter:Na+ symporter
VTGREHWQSRAGFVVATIGSAVGLGNIWRFSYVAGENGGGAFLLVYALAVALIGLPLVVAELALGRRGGGDTVAAFAAASPKSPLRHAGWIGACGAVFILGYYAVIAGWALKYFSGAALGGLWTAAMSGYGAYFEQFIANGGEPLGWQSAMLLASMLVVSAGVRGGIERLNLWLMPLLAIIVVVLAAFALSLPGSSAGVRFLLEPDWSVLARPGLYMAALGQAFFSVGVGMAIYITYGSYLPPAFRIPASALTIVVGDTLFAIAAGLAIFPAVFAMGADPAAGPRLAFVTLPQLFLAMPAGTMVGPIFFFLLAAAALTSMISLLEVPVAVAMQRLRWSRPKAVAATGLLIFSIGVPSALSYGVLESVRLAGMPVLDAVDQATSSLLLPLGGVAAALAAGWAWDRRIAMEAADLSSTRLGPVWRWLLRYGVPATIAAILLRAAGFA